MPATERPTIVVDGQGNYSYSPHPLTLLLQSIVALRWVLAKAKISTCLTVIPCLLGNLFKQAATLNFGANKVGQHTRRGTWRWEHCLFGICHEKEGEKRETDGVGVSACLASDDDPSTTLCIMTTS
jgi:hypothetical protein